MPLIRHMNNKWLSLNMIGSCGGVHSGQKDISMLQPHVFTIDGQFVGGGGMLIVVHETITLGSHQLGKGNNIP